MFPSWDSLSELQEYQELLRTVLLWGSLICVILAALGTTLWTRHNRKLETRITELSRREAAAQATAASESWKERAERAEAQLLSLGDIAQHLKTQAANRADLFTAPWRERFAESLKRCPPNSVGLVKYSDTAEAREFADVIEQVLRETNRLGGLIDLQAGSVIPRPAGRVLIQGWKGEESKPAVEALAAVLEQAGITNVVAESSPSKVQVTKTGSFIQIVVKPK